MLTNITTPVEESSSELYCNGSIDLEKDSTFFLDNWFQVQGTSCEQQRCTFFFDLHSI